VGLVAVSHRLTARDLLLARLLADHRALTTAQITALLFSTAGTARNRLRQLREMGFLERFTHRTPGGARVTCWVPGLLSARYVALADGQSAPTPRAVRQVQDRILANPQLDHLLGVNQFFTDLAYHARTHPGSRLTRWWSAERTAAAFAGRIHPDGHGVWQTRAPHPPPHRSLAGSVQPWDGVPVDDSTAKAPGRADDPPDERAVHVACSTVGFWLEHDTGSMPLSRVVAKLGAYQRLQQGGGPTHPILLWLPTTVREANLHRLLAATPAAAGDVRVATAVHRGGARHPAGAVWWVADPTAPAVAAAPSPTRIPLQGLPLDLSGSQALTPPVVDEAPGAGWGVDEAEPGTF
jgi:hypothetical protein